MGKNRIWKFGKIGGGTVRQVNHPYFKCHVAMNGAEPTKDNGVFLLSNAISTTNALCSRRTFFSSLPGGTSSVPEGAGGSFQVPGVLRDVHGTRHGVEVRAQLLLHLCPQVRSVVQASVPAVPRAFA